MQDMVRVRFAPSPTGILHVGGIRTALFNYFFAKSQDGVFILRNEDTDQSRKVEGSLEATMESLKWLGVSWDEFVTQSTRLDEYKKYTDELISKGLAKDDEGAVRFITPKTGTTSWIDSVGNKEITFENENIEDFIILKKDGFPTYHLANVVDDHLMEITHVIRGEDWIPSAPKHLMLYQAFNWKPPVFAHVPNVMGDDGKKLSKRRGAKSALDYKSEGILPEALCNYLMLLGWSPKDNREILSKEEITKDFRLKNINSASSIFSEQKLEWMNGEYIRSLSNENLLDRLLEFDSTLSTFDKDLLLKLVEPAKTRMKKLTEFKKMILPFLQKSEANTSDLKNLFVEKISKIDEWEKDKIIESLKEFLKENDTNFPSLYELIIGERQGLPLGDVFEILGKERIIALLK